LLIPRERRADWERPRTTYVAKWESTFEEARGGAVTRENGMDEAVADGDSKGFGCPWCGAYTQQRWFPFVVGYENKGSGEAAAWWGIGREAKGFAVSFCEECGQPMVWHEQSPIWPSATSAPPPAKFMPDQVRVDFEEARRVLDRSPRSAAALLRLSLEKLSEHLGRPGTSIDDDLRALVESGLPDTVRQALCAVRAAGNDAVHPGELDARDNRETALALFDLVNVVVDKMIAEPAAWRGS
jgi:hypothetical protein